MRDDIVAHYSRDVCVYLLSGGIQALDDGTASLGTNQTEVSNDLRLDDRDDEESGCGCRQAVADTPRRLAAWGMILLACLWHRRRGR